MMIEYRLTPRILIAEGEETSVAHSLEFGIIETGKNASEAFENLVTVLFRSISRDEIRWHGDPSKMILWTKASPIGLRKKIYFYVTHEDCRWRIDGFDVRKMNT